MLAKQLLFAIVPTIFCCLAGSGITRADELVDLARQAASEIKAVTSEQVAEARAELAAQATKLEAWLGSSASGERWKAFLGWEGVQSQLAEGTEVSLPALQTSLDRLRANEPGLELQMFRNTATTLQHYIDLLNVSGLRDQNQFFSQQFEVLARTIERYRTKPTVRARFEIERRLDILEGMGAAQMLRDAFGKEFSHENLHVVVREAFLQKLVDDAVDKSAPVTDCILGTSIHGTGNTQGQATVELIPNSKRASIEFLLSGSTNSHTVGYNSPVVIRSTSTTTFAARKRIELDDDKFWAYPAQASATTNSRTNSVSKQGGGLGSRFIAKIGARKVAEKKPQADAIAGEHAETRIENEFTEELLTEIQDLRFHYENDFQKPFARRNGSPQSVRYYTTDSELGLSARQAGRAQLAADTTAPSAAEGDVSLRVHETAICNTLGVWLGAATLKQGSKDEDPEIDVTLPEWLSDAIDEAQEKTADDGIEPEGEFKAWSLRFRRLRPISMAFGENQLTLTLHAARITVGKSVYDNWDVSATYALHEKNGSLYLIRQGEIDVMPSRVDVEAGQRPNNREIGLRGNLAKEFNRLADEGRGLKMQFEIPPIELSEEKSHLGPLLLQHVSSANGWLNLAYSLGK